MSSVDPSVPGDAPVDPAVAPDAPAEPPTVEAPVNVVAPDPPADAAPEVPGPPDAAPAADPAGVFPPVKADGPLGNPVSPVPEDTVGQTDRPDVVPGDAPALDTQATDPATGEPLTTPSGAAILPLPDDAAPATDVNPADNQVPVATVQAAPDPSGAAALVLGRPADAPPAVAEVPTRAEVAAQQVLDEGTLTPAQPGTAVHPVETLDGHTVDPSGTADDHMPGAAPVAEAGDTSLSFIPSPSAGGIDQRIDPADRNKGISNVSPEQAEELFMPVVRILAESGVHRDLLAQWVDQGYADLQGQNSTAQSAGDPIPYPNLVH